MQEFVEYGNSKIDFKIKRTTRKTLGLSVLPCGSVEVTAPESAPIDKIKELVIKRGSWLLEQRRLTSFNPIPQPQKEFISGESFYLLGRHLRLKVFESSYDSVEILDDRIILYCTFPKDFEFKRQLMLKWYSKKAFEILTQRFQEKAKQYNQPGIDVVIKKLSKTWGEFHPSQNTVFLNMELIVAPIECIDYVIVHELCHAIIQDHSSHFYDLLSTRLPRWNELKSQLESHSLGLSSL